MADVTSDRLELFAVLVGAGAEGSVFVAKGSDIIALGVIGLRCWSSLEAASLAFIPDSPALLVCSAGCFCFMRRSDWGFVTAVHDF